VVSLNQLEEDKLVFVIYRGRKLGVMLASDNRIKDLVFLNESTLNGVQIQPGIEKLFILSLSSPHLGCIVKEIPKNAKGWFGGYVDECHGLIFDYAGRALKPELLPDVKRRVNDYSDMKPVQYKVDTVNKQIIIGQNL